MKKIAIIAITIALMASLISLFVYAEDTTTTTENVTLTHYLEGGDNTGITHNGQDVVSYINYNIYTINDIDSFTVPLNPSTGDADYSYSLRQVFFLNAYQIPVITGYYDYKLSVADETQEAELMLNIIYDEDLGVTQFKYWIQDGNEEFHICSSYESYDVMLYYNSDSVLCCATYDSHTGDIFTSGVIGSDNAIKYLEKHIFKRGELGNVERTYEDGYYDGYMDGSHDGYNNGLADTGIVLDQVNSKIEQARKQGYENGYNEGFIDGKNVNNEGKYTEADLRKYYDIGYLAGQDTNGIVSDGISGFFSAVGGFFKPFMAIGIGNLTVYSIVALAIIASVVVVIVKIVRK